MNSSTLAARAGVSIRTLRHYHQIGILPEPEREPNGYRRYAVGDLVRVLRIKRLASLGIALEEMPRLLDEPGAAESEAVLAELDRELRAQIRRLQHQRRLVAELRAADVAPDVPPELARFATLYPEGREDLAAVDRDVALLIGQLVDGDALGTAVAALADTVPQAVLGEVFERFATVTDAEVEAVAQRLFEVIERVAPDLELEGGELVDDYLAGALTAAQHRVLVRVSQLAGG